jgi:hypothetical protein
VKTPAAYAKAATNAINDLEPLDFRDNDGVGVDIDKDTFADLDCARDEDPYDGGGVRGVPFRKDAIVVAFGGRGSKCSSSA